MLKGRKFIAISFLGITGLVLLSSVSVPIQYSAQASVPYSLDPTTHQFQSMQQLAKWFLPYAQTNSSRLHFIDGLEPGIVMEDHSLRLLSVTPGQIDLSVEADGLEKQYSFFIRPDPKQRGKSIVKLSLFRTAWKRWIDPDPVDREVIQSLYALEAFTNDTKRVYGFPIRQTVLTDSCYLFMSETVPPEMKARRTSILFDSLIHFVHRSRVEWGGKRIYFEQHSEDNQLKVFTGVVVSCSIEEQPAKGFGRKTLPTGQKMLVTTFEGPYKEVEKAYKALEQYRRDYSLVSYITPFEDLLSPGAGYSPEDTVRINICSPIL
jgi:effector-binding domain-containing protein